MIYSAEDYQTLMKQLNELSEEPYRLFNAKLIPDTNNILGVRMPQLKKFAKEIIKNDSMGFLAMAEDTTHEELLLQGLVIGLRKAPFAEKKVQIANFVPKIKNWAVCDTFCSAFRFADSEKNELWDFLMPYTQSSETYDLRFAIVMLMNCFLVDDRIDDALHIYAGIRHDGYYVKMALAWALSVCFVKYRYKTLAFLEQSPLDDFTHNKTIQKICESFRVLESDKQLLRSMKRK